jgi:hypothetical protein
VIAALVLAIPATARADDEPPPAEPVAPEPAPPEVTPEPSSTDDGPGYALHGFVLASYAARLTSDQPPGAGPFVFAEERARLEIALDDPSIDAAARFKIDAAFDSLDSREVLELREAYVDYRVGPFDFRLGRQTLSWGVGDLQFVNDVFPKDFAAFFTGRPIEYLKAPTDALRTTLNVSPVALDLVAIPFFTPDTLPRADRFTYAFDPFPGVADRTVTPPERSARNTELAARLHGSIGSTDVALYAYRGFFHAPSFAPDDPVAPTALRGTFAPLSVYGASLQRNLLGGVLALEGGYYDSRTNRDSANPLLPTSFTKWLAGFQRELRTDFTVGVQYVGQLMRDHATYAAHVPPGFPALDRFVHTATLRITRLLRHQTLRLSAFVFAGITERDLYAIPEVEYKLSDRLSIVAGANVFAGKEPHTTFGIFRRSSNAYSWVRFAF